MRYTIMFLSKKGKVKGKVGCNTEATVNHLVNTWKSENKRGVCIIRDNEYKTENVYEKQTFSKKVLDKLKNFCYNKYRK